MSNITTTINCLIILAILLAAAASALRISLENKPEDLVKADRAVRRLEIEKEALHAFVSKLGCNRNIAKEIQEGPFDFGGSLFTTLSNI